MRSERRSCAWLWLCALGAASPAGAQVPYTVFDNQTEVRALHFRLTAGRTFSNSRLAQEMVLHGRPPLHGLRRTLAFLPFIEPPLPIPFTPIDLQRDVARLRRFYAESGFMGTDIRYQVDYHSAQNVVDIDVLIAEGQPITIRSIRVETTAGGDPGAVLPADLQNGWRSVAGQVSADVGRRFTQAERAHHESVLLEWWRNRGWAFARVETQAAIDSSHAQADLHIHLDPGDRARIGSITIDGEESVSENIIRRTLPFQPGDWFSARGLAEGQRRVFNLDLFRLALIDVSRDSAQDSTALVRVRVEESPPRLFTGEVGYVSTGGISTQAQFAHRNFLGGARTLRVSALAETGTLAVDQQPERNYRLTLAYREPYLFHPRFSLNLAPFGQYRDDLTDRSWQAGIETSLLYDLGAFRLLTLQHRLTTRRVLDFRLGSGDAVDLTTLLRIIGEGGIDSLGKRIDRSTFSITGAIGRFDPTRPTAALQVRPSLEVTAPAGLNTIEYVMLDVPFTAYRPVGRRVAIAAQARVGRILPFGKTVTGDSISGALEALQLRDVLLTAGGTGSVRGWGEGMLGPKFVNLRFTGAAGSDSLEVSANGYAPSGGMARVSSSLELQLPFPGLGEEWGTHVFLDAGRVWTPDARFRAPDPFNTDRFAFATGGGVSVRTLVGPVRVSLAYKLNPTPLDVRAPEDVLAVLLQGLPATAAPAHSLRRFHLHISLGQSF